MRGLLLSLFTLFLRECASDEGLPRPRLVVLGQQGVGKSSISNALLGYDNTAIRKAVRKQSPFQIGHGLKSKTQMTTFSTGEWLGHGSNITVVDTPGFKDTKDAEFVEELTSVLGDEVPEVDAFLIVYKYKDRFTAPFQRTLSMIARMFGNIWHNVVIVVNFWDAGRSNQLERMANGMTEEKYTKLLQATFKKQISAIDYDVPVVFLDSHFSKDDQEEVNFFNSEASKLYSVVGQMSAFECIKRSDISDKLKRTKNKSAKQRKKLVRRQKKLKQKMARLMANLKTSSDLVDFYRNHCPDASPGCQWGEWSDWSGCIEGERTRVRPRLIGEGENCEGDDMEKEMDCVEVHSENWLEDDQNVAYVFGGLQDSNGAEAETAAFSNSGDCNAPAFPEWRQIMTAAYSKNKGMMACGGLNSNGDPTDDCWVFTEENQSWTPTAKVPKALQGSASSWYKGEFWLFGGSSNKGSDKGNIFTTNDQTMKYNPESNTWSVPLDGQMDQGLYGGCVVNVPDAVQGETLVFTGGSQRKINLKKRISGKNWVKYMNDAAGGGLNTWQSLPDMKIKRATHSCTFATIGGDHGIVVAGGSNNGDDVEFLDWDEKKKWIKIARLNRQRKIGSGMAFIRGKLSMIGGYAWPDPMTEVEEFNADDETWGFNENALNPNGKRFNHVALTIPKTLLPVCPLLPMIMLG